MRHPIILLVHLIATLARFMGPGGLRSVVAESLLVKHQLLILNRSRHRWREPSFSVSRHTSPCPIRRMPGCGAGGDARLAVNGARRGTGSGTRCG